MNLTKTLRLKTTVIDSIAEDRENEVRPGQHYDYEHTLRDIITYSLQEHLPEGVVLEDNRETDHKIVYRYNQVAGYCTTHAQFPQPPEKVTCREDIVRDLVKYNAELRRFAGEIRNSPFMCLLFGEQNRALLAGNFEYVAEHVAADASNHIHAHVEGHYYGALPEKQNYIEVQKRLSALDPASEEAQKLQTEARAVKLPPHPAKILSAYERKKFGAIEEAMLKSPENLDKVASIYNTFFDLPKNFPALKESDPKQATRCLSEALQEKVLEAYRRAYRRVDTKIEKACKKIDIPYIIAGFFDKEEFKETLENRLPRNVNYASLLGDLKSEMTKEAFFEKIDEFLNLEGAPTREDVTAKVTTLFNIINEHRNYCNDDGVKELSPENRRYLPEMLPKSVQERILVGGGFDPAELHLAWRYHKHLKSRKVLDKFSFQDLRAFIAAKTIQRGYKA